MKFYLINKKEQTTSFHLNKMSALEVQANNIEEQDDTVIVHPINQDELKVLKLLPPLYKADFYYGIVNYKDPTALDKLRAEENTLINVLEKKTKIDYKKLEGILFALLEEGLVGFISDNGVETKNGFVRRWHLKLY